MALSPRGTDLLGVMAALTSSATWAYASARYALAAREVSAIRVNFVRMLLSWPIWLALALATSHGVPSLPLRQLGWLTLSTFCSYAFADSLFFSAARRIGVSSALAIASTYPLWAALKGTLVDGEPFGLARAAGTTLCVAGVAAIIKTGAAAQAEKEEAHAQRGLGLVLAIVTSVLWAGNTISIKAGSVGLPLFTVNAIRYGLALAVLGGLILSGRAPGEKRPTHGWSRIVPAIVSDCLFGSACFIYGLGHTDLAVGATLTSLAPLLSLPIAVWMGAEKLSSAKLAAVVVTVGGIVLLATS